MTEHSTYRRAAQYLRDAAEPLTRTRHRGKRAKPRRPRLRRPDYPRSGRTGWRRWIPSWRQLVLSFLTAVVSLTVVVGVAYSRTEIPEDLNSFATQQDNVYYWSDGSRMARTGWVSRQEMPLEKIPEHVRWAVLAAENADFYSDPGVSVGGITRGLLRTVGEGDTQGGSTITQQYVKNVYLTQDQSFSRKFTEMLLAIKLDRHLSKDQILEDYLNTSWFGRGTYGLQRASQAYYGKEVTQLNASEGAFLAALLKGASLYDPAVRPANRERAVERWSWTLDRMVEIGKLSREERARYTTFPEPRKPTRPNSAGGQDGYLVELAETYAKRAGHITEEQFALGGYQIYTTFDKRRMTALTKAVGDSRATLDPKDRDADRYARFGAASVAPDGRILAVHGGPDHKKQAFNESNTATVPAGTAFTPFVYAAALEHGVQRERNGPRVPVTPSTVYDGDDGVTLRTPEGPYWDRGGKMVKGHNLDGRSHGRISLRQAMADSADAPFLQLGMDVGLDRVRGTAQSAGLLPASFGPPVPDFALGNSTPSAIRMAAAYSTFAARGTHTEPYSVQRITRNGAPVPLTAPRSKRAVSPAVAARVTEALGPGGRGEYAGKSGGTKDDTARWYVGYGGGESTAVVVYRMDLAKSLAPLPLEGLGGESSAGPDQPAEIFDQYTDAVSRSKGATETQKGKSR
ncbi:transglycosylase domain-containing protein [Streptomyces sp. SP18CS02]|uniref:transglycosylase domain-containing protein n=1 Tax=Streptomyces sp. SP18CS02 TaxID=3002531 RepID=UPI002E79D1B8|nr:transglycosylase domain-containing protein [Streptomyces sp. SP18CS02]MEE1754569.1 transglycosylase domain-containing protein [Streptomyces sp. SP18CS02]